MGIRVVARLVQQKHFKDKIRFVRGENRRSILNNIAQQVCPRISLMIFPFLGLFYISLFFLWRSLDQLGSKLDMGVKHKR